MHGESAELGVLVGYDGSRGGERALEWAVREAGSHGTLLTVCTAGTPAAEFRGDEDGAVALGVHEGERNLCRGHIDARRRLGCGVVRSLRVRGPAVGALRAYAGRAEMVVVGSRGLGGFRGLPLGSVSSQVCAHAPGRVVLVPGAERVARLPAGGEVVAGFDGSACAGAALGWAFEEAGWSGAPLVVVRCWRAHDASDPGDPAVVAGERRTAVERLEEDVARWREKFPEVDVRTRFLDRPPRETLGALAERARLLAVGARGCGGLRGMPLGSVSRFLVEHSRCPVAVAHDRQVPGGP
ncbi:universal stress protein [Actinomadura viridis]|uniref:Nucleotide-binding universal stress UspA family protein n=1 Tax=Actinomadura viridis TaxID=58110 RepID=A0A931GJH1_9ACTN|nr:universal stress protein [Actinomadura viridis]MBG6089177.1 nucleotide-binding universal stress UspA family protein [Actinomadura viridis]